MPEEVCKFYRCDRKSEKDGYCFLHKIYSGVPDILKVKKPLPKKSAKRKTDHNQYLKIVKSMIKENPDCEIKRT